MSNTEPPKPRKRPKQSRSLMLVTAIEQACLKILDSEGPDKLTTQRIADVAGVNIASVYQYFPNKEAVLANVFEEEVARLADEAAAEFSRIQQLSEQSLEQTLEAIIALEMRQLAQLHRMNPEFYRQYQHSFDIQGRVNALTQSLSNPSWESWFEQLLQQHRSRLRDGDFAAMSFLARNALDGSLRAALSQRPELLIEDGFRKELLLLLLRFLLKEADEG